jgi:hypothetical protein
MDGGGTKSIHAGVPLTKIFEYALFFDHIDLFMPIPRHDKSHFNVYKDDRFAWDLNQIHGKKIGEASDFRKLFDDLVKEEIVTISPSHMPILDIELIEVGTNENAFEVTVWQPHENFDPFGHPYVNDLTPYTLPNFDRLAEFGKLLMIGLSEKLSSAFQINWNKPAEEFAFRIENTQNNKILIHTDILAKDVNVSFFNHDPLASDEEAHIYQIYYLVCELLRISITAAENSDALAPSMARRESKLLRGWEPDDVSADHKATEQMRDFFHIRAGKHPDIRTALLNGRLPVGELSKIFEKSVDWKKWISEIGDDVELAQAYLKSLEEIPTVNKLPMKLLRLTLLSGVSLGGFLVNPVLGAGLTIAGVTLGVADMFAADHVGKYSPKLFWSEIPISDN